MICGGTVGIEKEAIFRMNYYISDLHLFHEASIRFDERPFRDLEEMHTEIVKKWNNKVTNGDTVYILGDVSMRGKNEDLIALVAILKGKKVLIRGTILLYGHTHNSPEDDYFQKCLAEMKDNDCRHIGDSAIQAYNVGCMKPWMDYEPRSLQEIIKMKFVGNGN